MVFIATHPLLGGNEETSHPCPKRERLISVDITRGLLMTFIIYYHADHRQNLYIRMSSSEFTIGDLVLAGFFWLMGYSMVLTVQAQLNKGLSVRRIFEKIVRRSASLYLIGVVMHTSWAQSFSVLDTLQMFGLCYLLVGTIECLSVARDRQRKCCFFSKSQPGAGFFQWAIALVLMLIQTLVMLRSELCSLKAFRFHNGTYQSCLFDFVLQLNGWDLSFPDDSEYHVGLHSILPLLFIVQSGAMACRIYLKCDHYNDRARRWFAWSLGFFAATAACVHQEFWPNRITMNVPFCMLMAAISFLLTCVVHYLIDVKRLWNGWPFFYLGRNSLAIYISHESLAFHRNYRRMVFHDQEQTAAGLTLFACANVIFWITVAGVLHRKKIFFSI